MNLYDAFVILLEATIDKDDDRQIRNARKRIAKKVEAMRLKKERAAGRDSGNDIPTHIPCWIEPFPPSN
jgi:hypothetical protein